MSDDNSSRRSQTSQTLKNLDCHLPHRPDLPDSQSADARKVPAVPALAGVGKQVNDSDDGDSFSKTSNLSQGERTRPPTAEELYLRRRQRLVLPSGVEALHFNARTASYTGKTAYYAVEQSVVSIHCTDSRPPRRPRKTQGREEVLPLDDEKNLQWRKSVGQFIGGAFLSQIDHIPIARRLWTLGSFPAGYVLTRRITRSTTARGAGKECVHIWLTGGGFRFGSPAEFAAHAIWLMRGAPAGECACKQCTHACQKDITVILEEPFRPPRKSAASMNWPPPEDRVAKRKFGSVGDIGEVVADSVDRQVKRRHSL
ncbi:unnamed protein product [Peniophora sp. CBMAI 1063]|nr:unnamed protein product [Peniophora sp. CBMAI 1063]